MGECIEKIYCCDRDNNDNALAAAILANDPDGYEGMVFCRWTADAIGKAIKIGWEKFV